MSLMITTSGHVLLRQGGLPAVAASGSAGVSNQTATFGTLTAAGHGGWKPVGGGDEVNLTSYDSLVSGSLGSHTPQVSGGRLSFTGAAGAPAGAVLRCNHAGGTVDVTIATEAATRHVAPVYAEISAADTAHLAGSAPGTIKIRRGTITDMPTLTGAWYNKDYTGKALVVQSDDPSNKSVFLTYQQSLQNTKFLTIKNMIYDNSAQTSAGNVIFNGNSSSTEGIVFDGIEVFGPPVDLHGDYTTATGTPWIGPWGINFFRAKSTVIRNSLFFNLYVGIACTLRGNAVIEDNLIHTCYFDMTRPGAPQDIYNDTDQKIFRRNVIYWPFGNDLDDGDEGPVEVHTDAFQWIGEGPGQADSALQNILFENNIVFRGDTRAIDMQTFFGNVMIRDSVVRRNILLGQSTHALSLETSQRNVVEENTVLTWDPLNPTSVTNTPAINLGWGVGADMKAFGPHTVRRNVVGSIAQNNLDASFALNDQAAAENILANIDGSGGRVDMDTIFDGPFNPNSPAAVLAAYTPIAAALADTNGAGALDTDGDWRTGNSEPAMTDVPTLSTPAAGQIGVTPAATIWDGGSAVTSRDLRYSTDEASWTVVTGAASPITGLSGSTLYYVQTREVNAIGAGPWSASATVTTT